VRLTEDGQSAHYIGLVRVVMPKGQVGLAAVSVRTLGAGWDRGPWLGWRSGEWIIADPSRCQLLIIIRSTTEAANAADVIRKLGDSDPCIADFTHTLRPSASGSR